MVRPRGQLGWVEREGKTWLGFWYEYDPKGKRTARRQRRIGDVKALTLTAAKSELRTWLDANVNTVRELPLKPTFTQIWAVYSRRLESRSKGHARTQKWAWGLVEPILGNKLVSAITEHDIEALFAALKGGSSAANKVKAVVKPLLAYAEAEGFIKVSPWHRTGIRIDDTTDTCTLEVAEVRGIRHQLAEYDLLIFDTLISTGLSQHEFLALRPDDVSDVGIRIDEGVFEGRVKGLKTKRRKDSVACPPEVLTRLQTYSRERATLKGEHCFLWPSARLGPGDEDMPMGPDSFTERLQAAAKAAGIAKKVDWLILRRTWGTLSWKNNTVATAAQLRNNPATTAKSYVKGQMDGKQSAVDQVWLEITQAGRVN